MKKLQGLVGNLITLGVLAVLIVGLIFTFTRNTGNGNANTGGQVPEPVAQQESPITKPTVEPEKTVAPPPEDFVEPTWTPVVIMPEGTPPVLPPTPIKPKPTPNNKREELVVELKTTTGMMAISPDGKEIVFSQLDQSGVNRQLWKFDIMSNKMGLVSKSGIKPQWSLDGKTILYEKAYWDDNLSGIMVEVRTVDKYGRNERLIDKRPEKEVLNYYWNQSNGINIVFTDKISSIDVTGKLINQIELPLSVPIETDNPLPKVDGESEQFIVVNQKGALHIIQFSGEQAVLEGPPRQYVTTDKNNVSETISSRQSIGDFSLSPDKKRIAYVTYEGPVEALWVADTTGKNQRQLFELPDGGTITSPQWSPDGQSVVIGHRPTGTYDGPSYTLTLIHIDTGKIIDLNVDRASNVVWSPDGNSLYYTRAILVEPPEEYNVSLHRLRLQ